MISMNVQIIFFIVDTILTVIRNKDTIITVGSVD
jgi:hypothetical protein